MGWLKEQKLRGEKTEEVFHLRLCAGESPAWRPSQSLPSLPLGCSLVRLSPPEGGLHHHSSRAGLAQRVRRGRETASQRGEGAHLGPQDSFRYLRSRAEPQIS